MSNPSDFPALIQRVRNGDAEAAVELVRCYESDLRILARVKLNDPRLRRVCDSMDICQSVLGNFFVRATAGQFDIDSPEQLLKLLSTMIRNKVTDVARRQTAERRNHGRIANASIEEFEIPAIQDTPSQIMSARELAEAAQQKFAPDERSVMRRRADGQNWDEIARELGGTAEGLRKKVTRAMDRVAKELGLEEVEEG
ncbi:MAG TPA: sigma-70 family RNA polymerase sigma factor [Planctomycetaceae bacterium]|nr:sigma-70 family RNA polymerase sigma factor [Planctomycetaceae bacterium]HQZ63652.1 sigma-70 family RNA polymerase sigma factor [Planctomycetaceae bacterium]